MFFRNWLVTELVKRASKSLLRCYSISRHWNRRCIRLLLKILPVKNIEINKNFENVKKNKELNHGFI